MCFQREVSKALGVDPAEARDRGYPLKCWALIFRQPCKPRAGTVPSAYAARDRPLLFARKIVVRRLGVPSADLRDARPAVNRVASKTSFNLLSYLLL
jgi:hypothetical protein